MIGGPGNIVTDFNDEDVGDYSSSEEDFDFDKVNNYRAIMGTAYFMGTASYNCV